MRSAKKFIVVLLVIMILADVCLASAKQQSHTGGKKKKSKKSKKTATATSTRAEDIRLDKREGHVVTLNDLDFEEKTKKGVWLVRFCTPWSGACKGMASRWRELGRLAGETIHVGDVDCAASPLTAKVFDVTDYPTIYLLGENMERTKYTGENTVRGWLNFVSEAVKTKIKMLNGKDSITKMYNKLMADAKEDEAMSKGSDVIVVTSENIDEELEKGPILVNFYATWCDHCKDLRPTWEKFATYAKSRERPYRVAKVNTAKDHDIATRFRVKGFPTIMFLKAGKDPVTYLGERTLSALIDYAESKMLPDPFDEL